jgi:hypothetical protein
VLLRSAEVGAASLGGSAIGRGLLLIARQLVSVSA